MGDPVAVVKGRNCAVRMISNGGRIAACPGRLSQCIGGVVNNRGIWICQREQGSVRVVLSIYVVGDPTVRQILAFVQPALVVDVSPDRTVRRDRQRQAIRCIGSTYARTTIAKGGRGQLIALVVQEFYFACRADAGLITCCGRREGQSARAPSDVIGEVKILHS